MMTKKYRQISCVTVLFSLILVACSSVKDSTSEESLAVTPMISARERASLVGNLSPTSPFSHYITEANQNNNHYVNILNVGNDALLARLHLIRNAQKSIFIQTFIWEQDETGRLLAYEIIEAAKRGVEVKIIVDFDTIIKEAALHAYLSTVHPKVKVKVYNPTADSMESGYLVFARNVTFNFGGLNQRMHNKIFIVDGQVGITGGRNNGNEYFDRGAGRNFRDSDVLLIGEVVQKMSDSFWEYWQHPLVVDTSNMIDVTAAIDSGNYPKFNSRESYALGDNFDEIEKCSDNPSCIEDRFIAHHFIVDRIDFFADEPGKTEEIGEFQTTRATDALARFILSAQNSIVMQTPYLVVGKGGNSIFGEMVKNNPDLEIRVSSNSLAAADHVYAYAYSYKNKKRYLKKFNWQIFEFKPTPIDADSIISPIATDIRTTDYYVSIHAKTYVVDSQKVWMGSFNLDPRSANLNTEAGVIIYDEQVALAVQQDIKRDMSNDNSWTIAKREARPILSFFSGIIGTLIQSIPIVDLWPFTYSGSYELLEGEQQVPMTDENFYDHYRYVGPFPETSGTTKEIETRLIKGFFGAFQGLI